MAVIIIFGNSSRLVSKFDGEVHFVRISKWDSPAPGYGIGMDTLSPIGRRKLNLFLKEKLSP